MANIRPKTAHALSKPKLKQKVLKQLVENSKSNCSSADKVLAISAFALGIGNFLLPNKNFGYFPFKYLIIATGESIKCRKAKEAVHARIPRNENNSIRLRLSWGASLFIEMALKEIKTNKP